MTDSDQLQQNGGLPDGDDALPERIERFLRDRAAETPSPATDRSIRDLARRELETEREAARRMTGLRIVLPAAAAAFVAWAIFAPAFRDVWTQEPDSKDLTKNGASSAVEKEPTPPAPLPQTDKISRREKEPTPTSRNDVTLFHAVAELTDNWRELATKAGDIAPEHERRREIDERLSALAVSIEQLEARVVEEFSSTGEPEEGESK